MSASNGLPGREAMIQPDPNSVALSSNATSSSDQAVFDRFAAAPGLAVAILAPDGLILYANETGVKMYGGGTVDEHIGRNMTELYPREWAEEKIVLLRRVAETGERLAVRYIWEGKRLEAQYQRIDDEPVRILVTAREGITDEELLPDGFQVVETETANFGPLSVLTPRELEVLSLIGHGKSARNIGEILGLSPRTVERHRDSIGKKLHKHDRVSLALIARAAGLQLRDARLKAVGPMGSGEVDGRKASSITEPKPRAVTPNPSNGDTSG